MALVLIATLLAGSHSQGESRGMPSGPSQDLERDPEPLDRIAADECSLSGPADDSEVRGIVELRAQATEGLDLAGVDFQSPSGALIARGSTRDGSLFTAHWDTSIRRTEEGRNQVRAVCVGRTDGASWQSAPRTYWVSNTRGSMLGTNGDLSRAHIDSLADDLKIRWLRTEVDWGFHQTEDQFKRDVANRDHGSTWPALVAFRDGVAYAHARGLRVLVIAASAPRWARGNDRNDGGNPWRQAVLPRYRLAFAEYAKQLCLEGADAVEIINEPNFAHAYSFGPDHPRKDHPEERVDDYVLLLRAVYEHVKADPRTRRCLVGIGAPAQVGHELLNSASFIHPTVWYRRLFHATADDRSTPVSVAGEFDFGAVHPYGDINVQRGPTEWNYRWPAFAHRYGDAAYGHGMAMVGRIRAEFVAAGEGSKKLWATEVGVATFGGSCRSTPCTTEAVQADWVRQYVRAWMTTESTGWHAPLANRYFGAFTGPMFYYQWKDKSDGRLQPNDNEGFFGLLRHDGSKKLAFAELKAQAAMQRP